MEVTYFKHNDAWVMFLLDIPLVHFFCLCLNGLRIVALQETLMIILVYYVFEKIHSDHSECKCAHPKCNRYIF